MTAETLATISASPRPAGRFAIARRARVVDLAWLLLSLATTLVFVSRAMGPLLRPGDFVQDDARIYLFWPIRIWDRELFRGDLLADYFQAVTPPGYTLLFGTLSRLLDPLAASKVLPPLLGLAAALLTFLLIRRLHPAPAAAFLGTTLASWYAWRYDDLISATPRAFLLPLLAAFLWAVVAERRVLAVALVVLSALFYPAGALIGLGVLGLRLVRLRGRRPTLTADRGAWLAVLVAGGLAGLVLVAQLASAAPYGPVAQGSAARSMPEFGPEGRQAFFVRGSYQFWLEGTHSGLDLRVKDSLVGRVPVLFQYAALAGLLPLLLLLRHWLPAARRVDRSAIVLVQVAVASLACFGLAHLVLFQLYLPNRYVKWSLPLVAAIAAALALTVLLESAVDRLRAGRRGLLVSLLAVALGLGALLYPVRYNIPIATDRHPTITAYLRSQPPDVLVAAAAGDGNHVPVFAARRVLASYESALPYHLGYYRQVKRRLDDLIDAYYTRSPRKLAEFAEQYRVDLFLVNRDAYRREDYEEIWVGSPRITWAPFTDSVSSWLDDASRSALLRLADRCAVADDGTLAVVPAPCVLEERDRQPAAEAGPVR